MERDEEKRILERFKADPKKDPQDLHINIHKNASNPIREDLLKTIHTRFNKNKFEYKSFSRFKPDDLR